MPDALDFLAYCQGLGLRIRAKGGMLLVSPKEKLLAVDAEWIRAHKAELLSEVQLLGPGPCPGVCPGGAHELCCGCPEVMIQYLMPDGLIRTQWCQDGRDVTTATHWRHRGSSVWQPVDNEDAV